MNARWMVLFPLALLAAGQAYAQDPDQHAQAITRASCSAGKQSQALKAVATELEHDPGELGLRLRLADMLVDQGCYQEAVSLLEAGQQEHPHSNELTAKLRDVRSLVTEQTYIEGLTQAAEGAKLQRNQLRCARLADIAACEDALKSKPDDLPLLIAKGDALVQANRLAEAVAAYKRAAQLKPNDESVRTKLASAEALQASTVALASAATQPSGEGASIANRAAGAGDYTLSGGGRSAGRGTSVNGSPSGTRAGTSAADARYAGTVAGTPAADVATRSSSRRNRGSIATGEDGNARQGTAGAAPASAATATTRGGAVRSLSGSTRSAARAARSASSTAHGVTPVESALASAAIEPVPPSRTYSNEAPPGQSN